MKLVYVVTDRRKTAAGGSEADLGLEIGAFPGSRRKGRWGPGVHKGAGTASNNDRLVPDTSEISDFDAGSSLDVYLALLLSTGKTWARRGGAGSVT